MTVLAIYIGVFIGTTINVAGLNPLILNDIHGQDAHIETHNQNKSGYDFPSYIVVDGDKVRLLK